MPDHQGDYSRLSRKQMFFAFAGLFVLFGFLLASIWLVIDSGKRFEVPTRKPTVNADKKDVSAVIVPHENTNFSIICSHGEVGDVFTAELTATGDTSSNPNSVTANGNVVLNSIRHNDIDVSGSYRVFVTLRRYACTCPNVNQLNCGDPADPNASCVQQPMITGTIGVGNGQVSATTTTSLPSGCATLQSDVNFSSAQISPNDNPSGLFGMSCSIPNPANSDVPNEISAIVGYVCVEPTPTLTSSPTRTPTSTPTSTPKTNNTPTPTVTNTPPPPRNTPTPTSTPPITPTPTATLSPTRTPTPTVTPTGTLLPTRTATPTPTQPLAGVLSVSKEFTTYSVVNTKTYANYRISIANTSPMGSVLSNIVIDDTVSTGSVITDIMRTPGVVIENTTSTTLRARIASLPGSSAQGIVIAVEIPTSGTTCPGNNAISVRQYAIGGTTPTPIFVQQVIPPDTTICTTPTPTITSAVTATPTPTVTLTGTATPTPTASPTMLPTITQTLTPTPTTTLTPTSTPTGTLTPSPTPTETNTPTPTSSLGEIGNYVWEDSNDNGLQDSGEPIISTANVQLLNCTDTTVAYATTNTNNQGNYLFSNLISRCYRVKFYPVSGYTMCTKQHIDPNKTDLDSDAGSDWISQQINLGVGASDLTIDACMRRIITDTDLSLTKTASDTEPAVWSDVTFTLTVKNEGGTDATNVKVKDYLPSGFLFVSATAVDDSSATYDSIENIWTIGAIAKGTSKVLKLIAKVISISNLTNIAEVYSMQEHDIDSTPNNLVTTEDDYASVTLIAKLVAEEKGKLADTGVASILTFGIGSSLLIAAIAIEEMRGRMSYRDLDDDEDD